MPRQADREGGRASGTATAAAPFPFAKTTREPLSVAVSKNLRQAIVSGQISVGTEMPSEKELGQRLGVGRSTVREALRILQAQGLLSGGDTVSTQRPRVSAEKSMSTAADVMENVLRLGQVPLSDIVELRIALERAMVGLAAARAKKKPAVLDDAKDALAVMKVEGLDVERFRAADLAFHKGIARATGNAAFPLVMEVLREVVSAHLGERLHEVPSAKAAMTRLAREHAAILAAIERGDGDEASAAVESHIRGFYRDKKEHPKR